MIRTMWFGLVVSLACACGDGDDKQNPPSNNAPDSGMVTDSGTMADQSGGDDVPLPDVANNAPNNVVDPGGCTDGAQIDVTFDIDPGEFAGQFYARTAWDGRGAWVVYNRPDSSGPETPEEIFAARIGCDGEVEHGPLRLSTANGARNYMPIVASRGGITHVAWVQQGANPDTILLQLLSDDGTVVLSEPADITPTVAGEPVSGLVWEPDLAVWEDGTGVVAVSAGAFGAFQIVLQRYDESGVASGDAITPYPEASVDQKRPTLAADPDGTLFLGWTRYKPEDAEAGTPEEPERVVLTSIPAGANMVFPASPLPARPLTTPNPIARYAREPGPTGAFFLAFQVTEASRQDILVRDGSDFQTAAVGAFGSMGYANFRPSIAAGKAGGVLAWYRYNQTPLQNDVMVHPFDFNGEFAPGAEQTIETDTPGVPPYGPDITWAGGNLYFVVWGEGSIAPEARVKGRWLLR